MKPALVLADRYSDAALKLLVSINVLFFLSFTIVLLIATAIIIMSYNRLIERRYARVFE